jgi:hypothetical protein
MYSRSASYFQKLATLSREVRSLANQVHADAARARILLEHKGELDRIYKLIESSARMGSIRTVLPSEDSLWKNEAILHELRLQGFVVKQGTIEWWQKKNDSGDLKN